MFLYLLSLSISIHYINQYQTPVLPMSCISSISSISSSISMISVDIKSISISINIYHIASICMISFAIKSISITHVLLHNITFPSISIISIDIKLILIAIVGICWYPTLHPHAGSQKQKEPPPLLEAENLTRPPSPLLFRDPISISMGLQRLHQEAK